MLVILVAIVASVCQALPLGKYCEDKEAFPFKDGKCYVPPFTAACDEGEWAVVTNLTLSCQQIPCRPAEVLFEGDCVNMFDPGACPQIGERLFVDKQGQGVCDCDDGWGRWEDGSCYQEFTRGFCEENQIVRIGIMNKERECTARTTAGKSKPCAFPFMLNNKIHTACAVDSWPQGLNEKVEEAPWCPTHLDENLVMAEDNWGICEERCQTQAYEGQILFSNEFRRIKLNLQRKIYGFSSKLSCSDNPCGDPRIALPHRSTWNESNLVCHSVKSNLLGDCEVFLDSDDSLKCCSHKDRIKCALERSLVTLSVINSSLGKSSRCKRRFVFSEFRQRCVRLYRAVGSRKTTRSPVKTTNHTTVATSQMTTMNSEIDENTTMQ